MPLFCIEWAQSFDEGGRSGPSDLPGEGIRQLTSGAYGVGQGRESPRDPVVLLEAAASRFNKPDAPHSGRLPELPTTSRHA
jgi:hypothetical protein